MAWCLEGEVALVRTLAIEPAPYPIRVDTVRPTGVTTPMVVNDHLATLPESPDFSSTRGFLQT